MSNAFDKVIGYDTIKNELLQICDMLKNREAYTKLGARLPQGILLYGDPGLGKSLMSKCFIEESELKAYVVRRNRGNDDFIGIITETFREAKENAPSIVFLDDMDKFANEDDNHRDAEEYVAVQAGIDEVKNYDVFVIATVNEIFKLPRSLTRPGRFDRKIEVKCPTEADATKIVEYYLADKQISDDVNLDDLAKMISYNSCAELESIINDAAITAAFARKDCIEMTDVIEAVLRTTYDSPDDFTEKSEEDMRKNALHEAGHIVACEVLCEGSVGLASLRKTGRNSTGGFIHRCKELERRPFHAIVALAGKAAVELYYCDTVANGCHSDINKAYHVVRSGISESATLGFGLMDVTDDTFCMPSENLVSRNEAATQAEIERLMLKTKAILLKNRDFLEKACDALIEKETLLYSDIRKIRSEVTITEVAV